jgi:hypothetical protein
VQTTTAGVGPPGVEGRRVTRTRLVALAGCVVAAFWAAASYGLGPAVVPSTGATPTSVRVPVRVSAYPVYDGRGRRIGTARWRMSPAGGNCCETYVTATRAGRIVESGGTYPWYTDDRGRHWYEVKFDIPDQNDNGPTVAGGEGATVTGPDGSVYGVTWDAYSGDHLQAYSYRPQQKAWSVSEVVVKTPFYDRPWLSYEQGPFVLNGAKVGHLLDVTGGGITKDVDTFSADGQDYSQPSFAYADEHTSGARPRIRIPVVGNPAADWWQPHPGAGTLPLSGGGVLRFTNDEDVTATVEGSNGCPVSRLDPASSAWQCVSLIGRLRGVVRQDSRGYLTEVYPSNPRSLTSLTLATSRDGGVHWSSVRLAPPRGVATKLETNDLFDVVANGKLGQAVVSSRWDDAAHRGHDIVFRVDTARRTPRVLRTYLVGKGDVQTGNDVTSLTMPRFDYESVALLPDGRIAVSFVDSTCLQPSTRDPHHDSPEVAILV